MPPTLLKKAQTQLLEIIAVMIILTILTTAIITSASYYTETSQTRADIETRQEQAQRTLQALRTRTELRCPQTVGDTSLCIDAHRAHATRTLITNNPRLDETYFELFGTTTLTINPIHPGEEPLTLYNQTPPNQTSRQTLRTPMTYHNATTNTDHFAILKTTLYQ